MAGHNHFLWQLNTLACSRKYLFMYEPLTGSNTGESDSSDSSDCDESDSSEDSSPRLLDLN